jgi:hypothetical protein
MAMVENVALGIFGLFLLAQSAFLIKTMVNNEVLHYGWIIFMMVELFALILFAIVKTKTSNCESVV